MIFISNIYKVIYRVVDGGGIVMYICVVEEEVWSPYSVESAPCLVKYACDQMESGWTIPDRSGEKVMANSHQTSLLWGKYFGLTRLVWLEGDG